MKNLIIITALILFVGCGTKKKVVSDQRNKTTVNSYIQIAETVYNKFFVHHNEIPFFSGELSTSYDQSALIENPMARSVLQIVNSIAPNLQDHLKDERIHLEIVFNKSGAAEAVSFRLPRKFDENNLDMFMIEKKIKDNIKVNVKNMGEGRLYILYTYPITSENLRNL